MISLVQSFPVVAVNIDHTGQYHVDFIENITSTDPRELRKFFNIDNNHSFYKHCNYLLANARVKLIDGTLYFRGNKFNITYHSWGNLTPKYVEDTKFIWSTYAASDYYDGNISTNKSEFLSTYEIFNDDFIDVEIKPNFLSKWMFKKQVRTISTLKPAVYVEKIPTEIHEILTSNFKCNKYYPNFN